MTPQIHAFKVSLPPPEIAFELILPRTELQAAQFRLCIILTSRLDTSMAAVKENESGKLILVVDDHDVNRELLSIYLGCCGYNVIEASNGLEAVKIAASELPHLIIMDLSMPVLDGFEAARLIREAPVISEVPILAYTAHDSSTHRDQALRVGFNEFLTKPIDFTELDCVVDRFLNSA